MLAALVSNLISLLIDRHSFYDRLKIQYLQEIRREDRKGLDTKKE
jgi:hypothetical protein